MSTKTNKILMVLLFTAFASRANATYLASVGPYNLTENITLSATDTPLQFQEDQRQFQRDMERAIQGLENQLTQLRQDTRDNLPFSNHLNSDEVQKLEKSLQNFSNDVQRNVNSAKIDTWEDTKHNLLVSLSQIRSAIESAQH